MLSPLRASLTVLSLILASASLYADVTFFAPSGTLGVGETATFSVTMDAYTDVIGFAYGICPSSPTVSVVAVEPGTALTSIGAPDFFQEEINPGVTGGHTVGCVVSFIGFAELPTGAGQEIVQVTYEGLAAGTTEMCFCDELGSPAVTTVYVGSAGSSVTPFQECGTIIVESSCAPVSDLTCQFDSATQQVVLSWTNPGGTSFHHIYRNGDLIGTISGDDTSFVDPNPSSSNVYVVESTCFPGEASSSCSVDVASAGDVNGDGMVNIGDAIYLLNYLNSSGPAPVFAPCP